MTNLLTSLSKELMLPQLLCSAIELIVNKALTLDSGGISLAALEQQTLTLVLSELTYPLSFTVIKDNILVTSLATASSCTITTSVASLRRLRAEQELTVLIKEGKLDVVGDLKVAQQFGQLADSLNIDWQSEIAAHIGDIPTHKMTQFGNKITKKLSEAATIVQTDIAEYIVHEQGLVVSHSQINAFNHSVTQLSRQVDEAEKRIERLIQALK